jgi:hypothetical protein
MCNSIIYDNGVNVGISNVAPAQKLDVTGNVQFSGALMPNALPGTVGQVLNSAGPGVAPTWGTATNLLYNNTFVAYSTAAVLTSAAWQIIPGMSVTVTVPAGMSAKIIVHGEVGIGTNGGAVGDISGTDVAIYRNAAFVANGGYKRVYLGDAFLNNDGNNTWGNPSTDIVEVVGAGVYTYDFRCWQQLSGPGTRNATVGGNNASVLEGALWVQVILQ